MAKKVIKTKKATAAAPKKKTEATQMSPVIQAGILFVVVSAILVCSYAFSLYL